MYPARSDSATRTAPRMRTTAIRPAAISRSSVRRDSASRAAASGRVSRDSAPWGMVYNLVGGSVGVVGWS